MEYAKLEKGALRRLHKIPHVSNPTAETLAAYAGTHGYKPLQTAASPGPYHTLSYTDAGENISQVWAPIALGEAQTRAMDELQQRLGSALSRRVSLPCPLGYNIVYDQDALINVMGMRAAGYCAAYIDADDATHTLNESDVATVSRTLEEHRTGLYAKVQQARNAIQQAETTAEVEQILLELSI